MIMYQQHSLEPGYPVPPFDNGDNDSDHSSVNSTKFSTLKSDRLMAEEMNLLPLHDRNALYEEIHGVSSMAVEENPQLLEDSLRDFQTELDKIEGKSRFAYDCIANQKQETDFPSKCIVLDEAFRLRFLRCVFFDPAKAAERMLGFLSVLHDLYGKEALEKFDGSMEFFIDETHDQVGFRSGYVQLLPFRDRSGRKILVCNLDALALDSTTRNKIFLYMTFAAGEDVATQQNGVVIVFWPGSKVVRRIKPRSGYIDMISRSFKTTPIRIASFHICFPSTPFFRTARAFLSIVLMRGNVTRVKVHTGERIELQYQLMGYGIPVSLIPTTETGTLKTKVFTKWVKARKLIESFRKNGNDNRTLSSVIECPGLHDVIFRSVGKSCMLNPGNVTFRGIFEQYHSEHIMAGQTEKKNLVWKIVEQIESRNGKFLTWDKRGWWIALNDRVEIRKKVAISMRGYNKQRRTDENRQHFKSSTNAFEGQDGSGKRAKVCGESSDESINPCGTGWGDA